MVGAKSSGKRKSYTAKFKLDVLNELHQDTMSRSKLAKKHGVTPKMLRDQASKEGELNSIKDKREKSIHITRRVGKADSKCHVQLDEFLFSWSSERSNKNLRVKDKYLQRKALNIAKDFEELSSFKASKGFIDNFKSRHSINSLVVTGCTKISDDAGELATSFISKVRNCVSSNQISPQTSLILTKFLDTLKERGKERCV